VVALAVAWSAVVAEPAAADAARPGDVRSRVTGVEPATPAVRVAVVGGDSFLRLRADPGTEVVVLGYEGEPYLRVQADGTVEVNDRSPARWLNERRLAGVPLPASADAKAEPSWRRTGGGGAVAWHDHRTHWMAPSRPDPPERDWTVPLLVDGRPVTVMGHYAYRAPAPAWPWWLAAAAAAAITAWLGWSGLAWAAGCVAGGGVLVVVVGRALWSLPGGASKGVTAVALGAVAVAAVAVAMVVRRRPGRGAFLAGGGTALVLFAVGRLDVFSHSVLVTSLPAWLDRLSVAFALGAGLAAVALGAHAVLAVPGAPGGEAGQLGGYQPSGTSASASGGPQDPRGYG
jgi:hypothetical protein